MFCFFRWLTLKDNKLYSLPKKFNKLQMLIHINLSQNNFSHIPESITKIKTLKYLHLENNEFLSLPHSVLSSMSRVKVNLMHNPLIPTGDVKVFIIPTYIVIRSN